MEQISRQDFRNAMARVAAPVNIVTTDGSAGKGGFTATAMCSVTDDPPALLVCMNSRSLQTEMFRSNGRFCVNVLPADRRDLASLFAGALKDMEGRYAAAEWDILQSGLPALRNAIVSFGCETTGIHRVGTHNVLIGAVQELRQRADGNPLLYFDRNYVQASPQLGSFGG